MKPTRTALSAHIVAAGFLSSIASGQVILTVTPGKTINQVIAEAKTYAQQVTIDVPPGTYNEAVVVDLEGLVIRRQPGSVGEVIVNPPVWSHAIEFPNFVPTQLSRATRIERLTFQGNRPPQSTTAPANGTSLVSIEGHSPTFFECKVRNNESVSGPGGVWIKPSSGNSSAVIGPLFVNCEITGNLANSGGGVEVEWNARFEDCLISNNDAFGDAAGLFISSNVAEDYEVLLINCMVSDNGLVVTPFRGGGFYTPAHNAAVRWSGSRLQGNRSEYGGGGFSRGRGLQMDHCVVIDNTAVVADGGGLLIETNQDQGVTELGTAASITSTKFIGNRAQGDGGAILIGSEQPLPGSSVVVAAAISNCLIATNESTNGANGGGGIYFRHAVATMTFTTIADNTAAKTGGRGVFLGANAFLGAAGCILWGNGGTSQRHQLSAVSGSTIHITYSDVQSNTGGSFPGQGNINLAPMFVSVLGNPELSYYLQAAAGLLPPSPCIDATNIPAVVGSGSVLVSLVPDTGNMDMGYHRNVAPAAFIPF